MNQSRGGTFSTDPIFLAGLDRSGKTPLRLMLSAHSRIAIARRTYFWSKYYNKFGDLGKHENFNHCLGKILESETIRKFDLDEDLVREEFWQGAANYPRLFAIILNQFSDSQGKSRWGEQMGMLEQYADLLVSAYPEAKILHMIRDPRDRFREKFSDQKSKPGKVGWETERWLKSISLANHNIECYPDNYLIIHYESYLSHPEDTIRQVCDFIGESFEPGMLSMDDTIRFGDKPIQFSDHRSNIEDDYSAAPEIDNDVLSKRELSYLQSSTISELLRHDYALEELGLSVLENFLYLFYDWPVNYAGSMAYKYSSSNLKND